MGETADLLQIPFHERISPNDLRLIGVNGVVLYCDLKFFSGKCTNFIQGELDYGVTTQGEHEYRQNHQQQTVIMA